MGALAMAAPTSVHAQTAAPVPSVETLQGKTLWTNLTFGMTPAEVAAAQPDAVPLKKPRKDEDGSTCELRLKEYRVQITIFEACFYFKEGRLLHVNLVREAGRVALFNDISDQIRRKYGPEQEGQMANQFVKVRRWHTETQTISLTHKVPIGLGGDIGDITWVYGPPTASEADRL